MVGSNLRKAFNAEQFNSEMCMEDMCSQICTAYETMNEIDETFALLNAEIRKVSNLLSLRKYEGVPDAALMDTLPQHMDVFTSTESIGSALADTVKAALINIKNFFLRLWAHITAFFKQLFDENSKVRNALLKHIKTLQDHSSVDLNAKILQMQFFLPTFQETAELIANLNILFSESMEMAKMSSIKEASKYRKGLGLFGYSVNEGVVVTDEKTKYKIGGATIKFVEGSSETEWTVNNLVEVSRQFASLCTNTAKLNAVKNSLENDVKFANYQIDKYLALGDDAKASELQYSLNDRSLRSSYIYNCSVIMQSYVRQMSTMLLDVWENIANAI